MQARQAAVRVAADEQLVRKGPGGPLLAEGMAEAALADAERVRVEGVVEARSSHLVGLPEGICLAPCDRLHEEGLLEGEVLELELAGQVTEGEHLDEGHRGRSPIRARSVQHLAPQAQLIGMRREGLEHVSLK